MPEMTDEDWESTAADLELLCDQTTAAGEVQEFDVLDAANAKALIADWRRLRTAGPVTPLPVCGTGMPETTYLNAIGHWAREAWPSGTLVHVGSSAVSKTWRDVDLRMILPDAEFDALFPGYLAVGQNDARWAMLSAGCAELARRLTGLPIDWQFQRQSEADRRYKGFRDPLDLHTSPDAEEGN